MVPVDICNLTMRVGFKAFSFFPHKEERITRSHFVALFPDYLSNIYFCTAA